MLNPDAMVRYYGLPTKRMTNNPGSKTAPTWKAVKRPNGTTDYIEQPEVNTYEKNPASGRGIRPCKRNRTAGSWGYQHQGKEHGIHRGTDLENLPKDIMTMHEKVETAAETLEQMQQMQQTEEPKPAEEKKEEVKENEPKQ